MQSAISSAYQIMQIPITIEGFTFTLWQLFVFSSVMFFLCKFLFGIFR